ncbi:hypothetical protein LINPERHAP1_LOCUS30979 [Linum perenne]
MSKEWEIAVKHV